MVRIFGVVLSLCIVCSPPCIIILMNWHSDLDHFNWKGFLLSYSIMLHLKAKEFFVHHKSMIVANCNNCNGLQLRTRFIIFISWFTTLKNDINYHYLDVIVNNWMMEWVIFAFFILGYNSSKLYSFSNNPSNEKSKL